MDMPPKEAPITYGSEIGTNAPDWQKGNWAPTIAPTEAPTMVPPTQAGNPRGSPFGSNPNYADNACATGEVAFFNANGQIAACILPLENLQSRPTDRVSAARPAALLVVNNPVSKDEWTTVPSNYKLPVKPDANYNALIAAGATLGLGAIALGAAIHSTWPRGDPIMGRTAYMDPMRKGRFQNPHYDPTWQVPQSTYDRIKEKCYGQEEPQVTVTIPRDDDAEALLDLDTDSFFTKYGV